MPIVRQTWACETCGYRTETYAGDGVGQPMCPRCPTDQPFVSRLMTRAGAHVVPGELLMTTD